MARHEILDRNEGLPVQIAGSRQRVAEPDGAPGRASRHDVAWLLSQMTFQERVRAYELRTFSREELFAAAGREPERMPMLNGEFEWIAVFSADLD